MSDITAQTLALTKAALANPLGGEEKMAKLFTESSSATTGLTMYDLQAPALNLYPVLTPLRNIIPRVVGGRGIQANWKAFTGINTGFLSPGVSEGNRGGLLAQNLVDYYAAFRGIGFENSVTFEAAYAAEGFDDPRARAVTQGLRSLMIAEEKLILGGNGSRALGTTPPPVLVGSTAGGTLAAQTWSVIVVALTLDGYAASSIVNGVPGAITRANADGSSDTYGGGSAAKSTAATVATTGTTGSITATLASVAGAVGYAWLWGPAGSETLGAITTLNTVVITAAAAGTQLASSLSGDNSANALAFDGLLTQVVKAGGYFYAMPTLGGAGTPLTADGAGGVVEIDNALQSFWDNYRLTPDTIWVSSQERRNITKKVLTGGSNGAQRFMINTVQGEIKGGDLVTTYLNKFSMDGASAIDIKLHPNLPPGTILFTTRELPYPLSGVGDVVRMLLRSDYYEIEWPRKSRRYEYGIYADGVLQNYFPPAFGVISNIANG